MHYVLAKNLSEFCSCAVILPNTEIKGSKLTNLVGEISRKSNIEPVAYILWGHLTRSMLKNQEERGQQSNLKCFEFVQKRSSKMEQRRTWFLRRNWTIEKMASGHQKNQSNSILYSLKFAKVKNFALKESPSASCSRMVEGQEMCFFGLDS